MPPSNSRSSDTQAFSTIRQKDKHYLKLALQISNETDDPKGKVDSRAAVGALIVKGEEIIAASANRLPFPLQERYVIHDVASPERYHLIEHAERAAIALARRNGRNTEGAIIYCTRFPCSDCARAIADAGITELVASTGFTGESHWVESQRAALKLLRLSGIKIRYRQL